MNQEETSPAAPMTFDRYTRERAVLLAELHPLERKCLLARMSFEQRSLERKKAEEADWAAYEAEKAEHAVQLIGLQEKLSQLRKARKEYAQKEEAGRFDMLALLERLAPSLAPTLEQSPEGQALLALVTLRKEKGITSSIQQEAAE